MPDESNPDAEKLLYSIAEAGAVVPPLFKIEVGQGLLMGVRRKRVTESFPQEAIALLNALPLELDADGAGRTWTTCIQLAAAHGLTLYDATYLELAIRGGRPLATLDARLALAARQAGAALALPLQ